MKTEKLGKQNLEEKISPEEFYSELTDPRKHNPDNYCYIVHAVSEEPREGLISLIICQGRYDFSQDINLLEEPKRISEKKLISTSIINQEHNETTQDCFFILDVPWSNFVSMSPRDSATDVTNPDFVLEYAKPPYTTPLGLIKGTKSEGEGVNEVVVTGNKDGNKVKISGVGIKLFDCGEKIIAPPEAERMREIASSLDIPVVKLMKISRIYDSEPEVCYGYEDKGKPVKGIYVNRNGYRYIFEGDWNETKLKEVFKSDKNFCGGYNHVSKKEYLALRPEIKEKLSTKKELEFLKQLDKWFKVWRLR